MVQSHPPLLDFFLCQESASMSKDKYCSGCEQTLPVDMFGANRTKADGKQTRCKTCRNLCFQAHYRRNKSYYFQKAAKRRKNLRAWFTEYKTTLSCEKCGYDEHHSALDFHHLDDSKERGMSDGVNRGWGKEKIKKEIAKCIILCANCHRVVHCVSGETVLHSAS